MNKLPVIYLLLCYTIYCGTPGGTQPGRKITEIKLRLLLSNKIKYKVSSLGLVLPWFNFLKIYANLFFCFCCCCCFFHRISLSSLLDFFSEETVNETPWLFGERGSKHRRTIKQIDCKTVGFLFFFAKSVKKSVKRGIRVLFARVSARIYF